MAENKTKSDENQILIGGKPFMNYVTGVVMRFTTFKDSEVVIKSRGNFISKAVNVAEVARRKFLTEHKVKVSDIKIGSEEFENKEGRQVYVSTLEITLKKE